MVAAHQRPSAAELHYLRRLSRTVNMLRAETYLYKEFSSIQNLEILGEEFIRQCYRDMPPATFRTTIMCRRVEHSEDSFYNAKTDRNLYTAVDKNYIDSLGWDMNKLRHVDCRTDADINPTEPLWVAMDANANINWAVIGQPGADMKLRILKSFYVKYERRLPELVDDICLYYGPLKHKEVVFAFDSTFVGNNYGVSKADFHTVVTQRFQDHGWIVREAYINTATDKNVFARVYAGEIWIDDYIMFVPEIVEITNEDNPHDFVIGMNILRHADFAVSNANGKTVFTIRFPPREKIDFTK